MTKELIEKLRGTASKGVSVWGDLQMEAADAIERLERDLVAADIRIENDKLEIEGLTREQVGLALDAQRYRSLHGGMK